MTSPDDEAGEMRRFSFSDPEALFSGKLTPDDAPPEFANGDHGIVKVRAPKMSDATALQTKVAFEVIDKESSS